MADGNRFQITMNGTYLSRPAVNVWYYKQSGGAALASDLGAAFETAIKGPLVAVTHVDYSIQNIIVLNMDIASDFAFLSVTSGNVGTRSGQAMPRAICWSYQYVRATRACRHGWKRFAGVSEDDQSAGSAVAGILTALETLETALKTPLSAVGASFSPVIFRYYSVPMTDPATVVLDDFPVADVQYVHVGTQNSRKHL